MLEDEEKEEIHPVTMAAIVLGLAWALVFIALGITYRYA